MSNFRTLTEIDRQVTVKLFDLSINRYSEVRRQAQVYLFMILSRFFFSYQIILPRLIELLNRTTEVDHDQIKGCLYIILGNESVFLPMKHSWSIVEQLWPTVASTKHAVKLSTLNLINCIMEKICIRFNTIAIIENTNELSRQRAIDLWKELDHEQLVKYNQIHEQRNQTNIQLYNQLMNKLTSLFSNTIL